MFVGFHTVLAMRTDQPALAISEEEGKEFMTRAQNVMRHYSVQSTQKTLDWIAFIGCGAGMYVPRIAAVSIGRKSQERASAPQARRPAPRPGPGAGTLEIVPDHFNPSGFQETEQ